MNAKVLIKDIFRITGIGVVLTGQVKEGALKIGMRFRLDDRILTVKTIEIRHQMQQEAYPGNDIGFSLDTSDSKLLSRTRGQIVEFSDDIAPQATMPIPQQEMGPTKPEGAFGFLKRLFK